jgi:hypothetical protein
VPSTYRLNKHSISFSNASVSLLLGDPPSGSTSCNIRRVALKKRKNAPVRAQGTYLSGVSVASTDFVFDIDESYGLETTIGLLSDNVLLEIFDFYRKDEEPYDCRTWRWRILVHVCQIWRQIVLASPHRLDLRILCTYRTPVGKLLCIWPALPIVLNYSGRRNRRNIDDDLIAALEHPNRVSEVLFHVPSSQLEKITKVMHMPLPVLKRLAMATNGKNAPSLPGGFLGGSAPSLKRIYLEGVPYPSLPTLLRSASDLVRLELYDIPPTGYISPDAMVLGLVALPGLEFFHMEFRSPNSRPGRINPPPATQTVLPSLTYFYFKGASEYLESIVTQIHGPRLKWIYIDYFNQLSDFRAFQLSQFIHRSAEGPQTTFFRHAKVTFATRKVSLNIRSHSNDEDLVVNITIRCQGIDWQASHLTQLLSQFSVTISNVVHLRLELQRGRQLEGADDVELRHLLHPFSTVKTLYADGKLTGHLQVALALEDVTPSGG